MPLTLSPAHLDLMRKEHGLDSHLLTQLIEAAPNVSVQALLKAMQDTQSLPRISAFTHTAKRPRKSRRVE